MRPPLKEDTRLRITHASAIEHLLTHQPKWIAQVEIDRPEHEIKGRIAEMLQKASEKGLSIVARKSPPRQGTQGNEPISLLLKDFPYADIGALMKQWESRPRVGLVALDHIQDPQNFGAICRSAEAFGAAAAIFPKDRSATVTSTVFHASAGAVATLPLCKVTNLGEALRKLKAEGFWVIGSELSATAVDPWKIPDFEKWVLVVGAEGDGMSPLIRNLCDCTVKIPLPGKVQSLNASAATSALLYELTRPRSVK